MCFEITCKLIITNYCISYKWYCLYKIKCDTHIAQDWRAVLNITIYIVCVCVNSIYIDHFNRSSSSVVRFMSRYRLFGSIRQKCAVDDLNKYQLDDKHDLIFIIICGLITCLQPTKDWTIELNYCGLIICMILFVWWYLLKYSLNTCKTIHILLVIAEIQPVNILRWVCEYWTYNVYYFITITNFTTLLHTIALAISSVIKYVHWESWAWNALLENQD